MNGQQREVSAPADDPSGVVAPPCAFRNRHRAILEQLKRAFQSRRPVAILTGSGRVETTEVVSAFLTSIGDDTTIVRICRPGTDAVEGMRQIIRGIGFDPKGMNRDDLEKVFEMFLAFQQKHRRRTIIDIESADEQQSWLLDHVSYLVELESDRRFGLMVLLSGRDPLQRVLAEPPLSTLQARAGRQIRLQKLSLDETRDLIRSRLAASAGGDIAETFEFEAIQRIHEHALGVADGVDRLYRQCLHVAQAGAGLPVSPATVDIAARQVAGAPAVEEEEPTIDLPALDRPLTDTQRLIAQRNGMVLNEYAVTQERMLVGRDQLCDIRLPSRLVSRRHAFFVRNGSGIKVIDLGSTNGTLVNGDPVRERLLADGDVIRIADCTIEFRAT